MHHGYVLGIGSNMEPEKNVPRIVYELVGEFGRILISRFYETAPVGMKTAGLFINFCVFVKAAFEPTACKAVCTNIEVKLGRDRTHPCRRLAIVRLTSIYLPAFMETAAGSSCKKRLITLRNPQPRFIRCFHRGGPSPWPEGTSALSRSATSS